MTIAALPTAPTPIDDIATFNARAFALVAALAQFVIDANATGAAADASASAASSSASTASAQAIASAASAAAAFSSALLAGSGAPLWVSGTTYTAMFVVVSPIDARLYRRWTAGGGTTDPSLDGANWGLIVAATDSVAALAALTFLRS
jgi:hypothetical protein